MVANYVVFARNPFGIHESRPFDLSFHRAGQIYISLQLNRDEAIELMADIHRVLEIETQREEPMCWDDLYAGTGIRDPEYIEF